MAPTNWEDVNGRPVWVENGRAEPELYGLYADSPGYNVCDASNEQRKAVATVLDGTLTGLNAKIRETKINNAVTSYAELAAFIAANPTAKCNVHVFGTILIQSNYTVPENIRVHIERGCLFSLFINSTLTILNIETPPNFQFIDISISGTKVVLGTDLDLNPIWTGAHGNGVTDDAQHFIDLKRSLDISGNERWMVLNHNHSLLSNPNILKVEFQSPNGKITHGLIGEMTFNQIKCDDKYHQCFICPDKRYLVTLANQDIFYTNWFGLISGDTASDFGKAETLSIATTSREIITSYGSYYSLTSAVLGSTAKQIIRAEKNTVIRTTSTKLRAIFRRVRWSICDRYSAIIVNNGSGKLRVHFAFPNIELYATVKIFDSSVYGNTTIHTVIAVTETYIDLDTTYTSDSTGTILICDGGTANSHNQILDGFITYIPITSPYASMWFGLEATFASCGFPIQYLAIQKNRFYIWNASSACDSTHILIGYTYDIIIIDNYFVWAKYGIRYTYSDLQWIDRNTFHGCGICIYSTHSKSFYINNNRFQSLKGIVFNGDCEGVEIYDNTAEHAGTIQFLDCYLASNIHIRNNQYIDIAERLAEIIYDPNTVNPELKKFKAVIENNHLGIENVDPVRGYQQYDRHGKQSVIYAEFADVRQNQIKCIQNTFRSERTGADLEGDYVVARVNEIRTPAFTEINYNGNVKNLGTEVEITATLTPETILSGDSYSVNIHAPNIDGTNWWFKRYLYAKYLPPTIEVFFRWFEDTDSNLEGVEFTCDATGHIIASLLDIKDTLDVDKMQVVVSGTTTLDGEYLIEKIAGSDAVKLLDSDFGVNPYETEISIDYTLVPTTQTVAVIFNLALITDALFWASVSIDGGNLRAYNEARTELPLEIIEFNKSANTGRVGTILVISHIADTKLIFGTGRWSLRLPAVTATYGRNSVWSSDGYKFALNNLRYLTSESLQGKKYCTDSSGNLDPLVYQDNDRSLAVTMPGYCFLQRGSLTYCGIRFGDLYEIGTSSFVFSTWYIYASSGGGGGAWILTKEYTGTPYSLQIHITTAGVVTLRTSTDGTALVTSTWAGCTGINNSTCHHLAFRKIGTDVYLYYDGALMTMTGSAPVASIYNNTYPLGLGSKFGINYENYLTTGHTVFVLYNPRFIVGATIPSADYLKIQYLAEKPASGFWKTPAATVSNIDTQSGTITPNAIKILMANRGTIPVAIVSGKMKAIFEYINFDDEESTFNEKVDLSIQTVTADTAVLDDTKTLYLNNATPFSQTLPTPTNSRELTVKNISSGTHTLIGTIDGSSGYTLEEHKVVTIKGNGTNWYSTGGIS